MKIITHIAYKTYNCVQGTAFNFVMIGGLLVAVNNFGWMGGPGNVQIRYGPVVKNRLTRFYINIRFDIKPILNIVY